MQDAQAQDTQKWHGKTRMYRLEEVVDLGQVGAGRYLFFTPDDTERSGSVLLIELSENADNLDAAAALRYPSAVSKPRPVWGGPRRGRRGGGG